jgi:hypothetical protein
MYQLVSLAVQQIGVDNLKDINPFK